MGDALVWSSLRYAFMRLKCVLVKYLALLSMTENKFMNSERDEREHTRRTNTHTHTEIVCKLLSIFGELRGSELEDSSHKNKV